MKLTTVTQDEIDAAVLACGTQNSGTIRERIFLDLEDEELPEDVDRLLTKRFGGMIEDALRRLVAEELIVLR